MSNKNTVKIKVATSEFMQMCDVCKNTIAPRLEAIKDEGIDRDGNDSIDWAHVRCWDNSREIRTLRSYETLLRKYDPTNEQHVKDIACMLQDIIDLARPFIEGGGVAKYQW